MQMGHIGAKWAMIEPKSCQTCHEAPIRPESDIHRTYAVLDCQMSHNQGVSGVQKPPQASQAPEHERDTWLIGPPNNHSLLHRTPHSRPESTDNRPTIRQHRQTWFPNPWRRQRARLKHNPCNLSLRSAYVPEYPQPIRNPAREYPQPIRNWPRGYPQREVCNG